MYFELNAADAQATGVAIVDQVVVTTQLTKIVTDPFKKCDSNFFSSDNP